MPASADAPFLELRDVERVYTMGGHPVAALRGVSLALPPGQFTAVVGRSGSGKSTLLHLLGAMDQPTAGTVRVGTWDLTALDDDGRARYRRDGVGMIFQRFHLVPSMTALENAALPLVLAGVARAEREARAAALLQRVGLGHRLHHRPVELSGGEQQRVAIARALAFQPPFLLADEPTGNLDSTTGTAIVNLLADLHRTDGVSVLVVTHNLAEFADVAQAVVTLQDGRVVETAG